MPWEQASCKAFSLVSKTSVQLIVPLSCIHCRQCCRPHHSLFRLVCAKGHLSGGDRSLTQCEDDLKSDALTRENSHRSLNRNTIEKMPCVHTFLGGTYASILLLRGEYVSILLGGTYASILLLGEAMCPYFCWGADLLQNVVTIHPLPNSITYKTSLPYTRSPTRSLTNNVIIDPLPHSITYETSLPYTR